MDQSKPHPWYLSVMRSMWTTLSALVVAGAILVFINNIVIQFFPFNHGQGSSRDDYGSFVCKDASIPWSWYRPTYLDCKFDELAIETLAEMLLVMLMIVVSFFSAPVGLLSFQSDALSALYWVVPVGLFIGFLATYFHRAVYRENQDKTLGQTASDAGRKGWYIAFLFAILFLAIMGFVLLYGN